MQKNEKIKIAFIGSGPIGIPSLAKFARSENLELLAIYTQIDKPAGRKLHLKPTPVADWAQKNNLYVKKINSINDPNVVCEIRNLKPDFLFLASFGQILKEDILSTPSLEPLNLHASLLPKYRGASPIQAAIINGEEQTGVSFMRMEKGLDTGPVFAKFATNISTDDTAESLEKKLATLAADHCIDVVLGIYNKTLKPIPQDNSLATIAKKIEKHDGQINWNEDAELIERKIRAYYPWPGAFTELTLFGKKFRLKIIKAKVVEENNRLLPGELFIAKDKLVVFCGKKALELLVVHPDGRKEMKIADFLHGFHKHL